MAKLRGLRSIAGRELERRKARYTMTALGIVLGVANVFGVLVTNASTNHAIGKQSEAFSITQVFAYPRGDHLDDKTIDALRALPDVQSISVFGDEIQVAARRRSQQLYFATYDRTAARKYKEGGVGIGRTYRRDRPEVVVTPFAVRELHLKIGRHVVLLLRTQTGVQRVAFTVTGVLRTKEHFGGLAPLEYIWQLRHERTAAELGLTLKKGVDPSAWTTQHRPQFPDVGFQSTAYPADARRFISLLQGAMSGAAAIALFVGAFLIYLTFSMAVVERTRMYGTLHAVGSTAGQVARAVLMEALLLGVPASAAGLAVGTGLSVALLRLVGHAAQIPPAGLVLPAMAVVLSMCVGVGASVVGSLVPAVRAARLSPVEAIRGTLTPVARPSRAWMFGGALVVAALALSVGLRGIQAPSLVSQLATLALLFGSVLLVPPLLGVLVRAGRGAIRGITGGLGDVAVMHLARERSRSAYTLGLVMVVLAMILALAATSSSVGRSVSTWTDKRFGADLLAYSSGVTGEQERAVANVRGVSAETAVTFGQVQLAGHIAGAAASQNLVLIDPDKFFTIAGFPWAAGSDADARRALAAGGSVLLPATLAEQVSVKRGGVLHIVTKQGSQPFRIAGIYASIASGNEVGIVAGLSDAKRFYVADTANVIYMNLDPGRSKHRVVTDIDEALVRTGSRSHYTPSDGPYNTKIHSNYFFIPGAEIKATARRNVRSYFLLFYAVLFVAVIVGLLGLANTMTTSVIQRFREFGLLGAVGAAPDDLRRMVIAEATMLVGVAFLLSLVLGTLLARLIVDGVTRLVGFHIAFLFPWAWIPVLAIGSAVIAMSAAVLPARRAARLTPVEALRYE